MEYRHYRDVGPFQFCPIPPDLGHRGLVLQYYFAGRRTCKDQYLWVNILELRFEVGIASLGLFLERRSVLWRAAFDYVCDINLFVPVNAYRFKYLCEQLARSSHKGKSLFILIRSGSFAYQHQVAGGGPGRKDDFIAFF